MDNNKKMQKFFDAIEDIEDFNDGSIIIKWKSNVSHQVPGHLINLADGLQIVKGKQVHFNPVLDNRLRDIGFEDLEEQIEEAVQQGKEYAKTIDNS